MIHSEFFAMFESVPYAMLLVNSKHEIVRVNKQAVAIFGYLRDELLGQKIDILIPERFRAGHTDLVSGFFAHPTQLAAGKTRDVFGLRKNHTELPAEIQISPIETSDGIFTLVSILDITERKLNEKEIQQKNKELENLLYVISHDLKEPLRSIEYFSTALSDQYASNLPPEAKDYLTRSINGAARNGTSLRCRKKVP